ncbi:MAG: ComEC/Rec2 family competence protein [Clostridium sp.]|nr:ComEC/Rec2 family competence protein [Clostridium sp.]
MAYLADGATAKGTGAPFFWPALLFLTAFSAVSAALLKNVRALIFLLLCTAGILRMGMALRTEPLEQTLLEREYLSGAQIRGTVRSAECREGNLALVVSEASVNGQRVQYRVRISAKEERCSRIPEPGDTVQAVGKLSLFPEAANPGQFDFRLYYRGQGIRYRLLADYLSAEEGHGRRTPVEELSAAAGAFFRQGFGEICSEEDAQIYRALLLGDRSGLDEDLMKLFRDNGISHILAVSGLHVSLIGLTVYEVLRLAGAGYGFSGFLSAVLLLLYGRVTGFGSSVFRAVFMLLCRMCAAIPGRGYDMLSAWGLALLLLSACSPWLIFSSGLQLSFGAILAIGMTEEKEKEKRALVLLAGEREKKKNPSALRLSIAVQLFTMPVILWHYFRLPVFAWLLNLLVIPLLSWAAAGGIAAAGLWSISRWLGHPGHPGISGMLFRLACALTGPGHYIFALYRRICEAASALPLSGYTPGRPAPAAILLYYSLLLLVFYADEAGAARFGRTLPGRILRACSQPVIRAAGLGLALAVLLIHPVRGLDIWFLDVGQGDGVFLRTEDCVLLSDCGSSGERDLGEMRLLPFLQSMGVTHLDYILVSHGDEDHVSGILWLLTECAEVRADVLALPSAGRGDEAYLPLIRAAEERGTRVVWMQAGDVIRSGALTMTCLNPCGAGGSGNAGDRNGQSLVFLAEYRSFRMMLTGDIGFPEEERILREGSAAAGGLSVLKTAHHGSEYSTSEAFLRVFPPGLAVISCARHNTYGHPAEETLRRLENAGARILCTARGGAVHVWTNGRKMRYTQYRNK